MYLINSLPEPNSALRANKLPNNTVGVYTGLGSYGSNCFVYRTSLQKLTIKYTTGETFSFPNQCSAVFENNTYITNTGLLLWLFKESNQLMLGVFNLVNRSFIRNIYITSDLGFASIAVDSFYNRLIIYKSLVANGSQGHSFIYGYTWTNNQLTAYHDATNSVPINSFIQLAFKPNASGFYRTFTNGSVYKIDHIFHGTLDDQLYQVNPIGGSNLVQNVNSDDLYYPLYVAEIDSIFCYNTAMTHVSAWSPGNPNTQIMSPQQVDTRANLFHSSPDKIGYPRLYFNQSTQTVYCQRSYAKFQVTSPATITTQQDYPLCQNNLVSGYPVLDYTDRQSGFILSNNSNLCWIRDQIVKLNDKPACDLVTLGQSQGALFINTTVPLVEYNYGSLVNRDTNTVLAMVYVDESGYVARLAGGNLLFSNWSASQASVVSLQSAVVAVNGKFYVKTQSSLIIYDIQTNSILANLPANFLGITTCTQAFCWNNRLYFFNTESVVLYDLISNTIVVHPVAYSDPRRVKLLPNSFNGKLYLYDADKPSELRELTIDLIQEDFTQTNTIQFISKVAYSNLPVGLRASFTSYRADFVNENDILFIDYNNNQASILQRYRNILVANGLTYQVTGLLAGSDIKVFGRLISVAGVGGLLSYTGSQLKYLPISSLKLPQFLQTEWSAYDTELVANVIQSGKINQYSFTTNTNQPANFPDNGDSHQYYIQYKEAGFTVSFNQITPYTKERLLDLDIQSNNDASKVSTHTRSVERYSYQITYYATEQQVTNFLNIYRDQVALYGSFKQHFRLTFRDNFYSNEAVISDILLTNLSYSWSAKDRYQLTVSFETI